MDENSSRILFHKLQDLERKIEILINIKSKLSWSVSELERENLGLKSANMQLKESLKDLKKKNSTLEKDFNKSKTLAKIVTSKLTPTAGIAEMKAAVEQFIEEIDKCIATLEDNV